MSSMTRKRPELRYTGTWWYSGSETQWRALPMAQRDELSFAATGCRVAYPTWAGPVHCVHVDCQIARGELPKIARVNNQLRAERESGWLRFITDRHTLAIVFRAHRARARQTGTYDIWADDSWKLTVGIGISG